MKRDPGITAASGRYFLTDRIREEVDFRMTLQAQQMPSLAAQKGVPIISARISISPRWGR